MILMSPMKLPTNTFMVMYRKTVVSHITVDQRMEKMFSVFYLYFNTDDKVDFHHKMNSLNNILADYDTTGAWKKKIFFQNL